MDKQDIGAPDMADEERIREVERQAADAMAKISAHEDLCALRYEGIQEKLGDLKKLLFILAGGLVAVLGGPEAVESVARAAGALTGAG
jgi:hypothetical protein